MSEGDPVRAGVGAGLDSPGTITTAELTPAQRASDERDWTFGGTWPYEPKWLFTDGIRIHYVDEGPRDGEPVVMLHGNPTWSYLYRRFIQALADAGFRAVAHDQLGFGRSDKPRREKEFSIQRHVKHFAALMDELGLDAATLVLQDWGGPIGLAWAVDHPESVRRLVILNTWPGGSQPDYPRAPAMFRLLRGPLTGELLVKGAHVFTRLFLFKGGTHPERLGENERAAYLAPHVSWESRTGVLAYPRLIPWSEKSSAWEVGRHVEANLEKLAGKPMLICWPDKDRAFKEKTLALWRARFPDAEVHEIEDAGHYAQEDAHEKVIPLVLDFVRRA
jgi:pimeloyl-ACP methyl ester carboxylesterase